MKVTHKTLSKKMISIVLMIVLLMNSLIFTVYASDDNASLTESFGRHTNTLYQIDNYSTYYFYNLHENFGYNVAGSCSYVAFGMLLSFYDIYWNPDFIGDSYLQTVTTALPFAKLTSSPGIASDYQEASLLDTLYPNSSSTLGEYYTYVTTHPQDYFHFYLMNIGAQHNLAHEIGSSFGLFDDQLETLINLYLRYYMSNTQLADSVSLVECTQSTDQGTIQYVASLIDEGIPVLLSGSGEEFAHTMVAYDYSTNSDGDIELYVHMGYTDYPLFTHVALSSTPYANNLKAHYLNVTSDHYCSLTYYTEDGHGYCSCSFGVHPEHIHNNYTYTTYNSAKHKRMCGLCGHYSYAAHVVSAGSTRCTLCGAIVSTDGPVLILGSNNVFTNSFIPSKNPTIERYITDKGSYILSNGIIVLVPEDMQSFLSNQLNLDEYLNG